MPRLAIILGAGFSAVARVPLAKQLFDAELDVDRITRERLLRRVHEGWLRWFERYGGAPEEYLAHLQKAGGPAWIDAVRYVALVIALRMGRVEVVGSRPTITRHNLNRTTGISVHEHFWTGVFRRSRSVAIVTTNYDILPERGIRNSPRARIPRPGFHYGDGPEQLAGGGYPSYAHIRTIRAEGEVPLLKLHGSVSWSYRDGRLTRYLDCRPAIRGDALITAPVPGKQPPPYLRGTWTAARAALSAAHVWLVVGYSLPDYDHQVCQLLSECANVALRVHVLDCDPGVSAKFSRLLPEATVMQHPGLPSAISLLDQLVPVA